jgi:uncharacterized cysteine cluster protein YcgN (CxxCxxCC family)
MINDITFKEFLDACFRCMTEENADDLTREVAYRRVLCSVLQVPWYYIDG